MKKGWETKHISDHCDVIAGQSPDGEFYNSQGNGLPFYQGKKEFGGKFIRPPTVWTSEVTKTAHAGDILMSVRAPVGPVNFATQEICIGRGLAAIRCRPELNRDFMFFQLLHLQPEIEGTDGAVFASISRSQIENLKIMYAPPAEQQRIVAILDEAFAGLATVRANAERSRKHVDAIFASQLAEVFSRRGGEWRETTLESVLAVQPQNGWSPPSRCRVEIGTPVLTLSSVTGFRFRPEKRKYTSAKTEQGRNYWVRDGDLLITRSNTPELVGHVAVAAGITEPTVYPDLIMRMNPNPEKASTAFLYYQLRSPALRKEISGRAQGANPTMKKLSNSAVRTLPIVLPSLDAQRSIAETLRRIDDETQRYGDVCERKLAELSALKTSLLRAAFAGNL